MSGFSSALATEIDDLIEHFNANHVDTLNLIARIMIPYDAAVDTQIAAVTPDNLTLVTKDAAGDEQSHTLALPQPSDQLPGLQQNVMLLIGNARNQAGERIAITSMEAEIAHTATLTTYHTQVSAARRITPTMQEITFSGGLANFRYPGTDTFMYVMVPHDFVTPFSSDYDMSAFRTWAGSDKPHGAYYTIKSVTPDEMTMWFVLHGDHGALSRWAAQAKVGDPVALWGPRTAFHPPEKTLQYLLIGDETAIPALSVVAASRNANHRVVAVLEAQDETHAPPLAEQSNVEIHWCYRHDAEPGTSAALYDAVQTLSIDTEGLFVFGAGETRQMAQIRKYLRNSREVSSKQMHLTGYWRRK